MRKITKFQMQFVEQKFKILVYFCLKKTRKWLGSIYFVGHKMDFANYNKQKHSASHGV